MLELKYGANKNIKNKIIPYIEIKDQIAIEVPLVVRSF
tara:strand:+ start:854 stop:967 length:114 start_codon:yes stop_codon:yes gene_type:complete